jgi:mxaJ protein
MIYGDYTEPNTPARLIEAVARGDVDVALAWGPVAGYFAPRQSVPLALQPVSPLIDGPTLPMIFDISMGLRREDVTLKVEVEAALERLRPAIDALLVEYDVPRLDPPR